jgi:dihydrofolate reductase
VGRLIITTAATVDGVIDGFEWYVLEGDHGRAGLDQFTGAEAMLLGRKTYEGLAAFWPTQEGPWADVLNPMPKVVASRTLSEPLEWNARLLHGELGEAVPRLKDELGGDVIVSGCGELARNLLAEGVVDEIRFWVHPWVWGDGARPFQGEAVRLRLLGSEAFDSGVTLLRYEPVSVGRALG